MDSRRKRRHEEKLIENLKNARDERPKISDQFADLKGTLAEARARLQIVVCEEQRGAYSSLVCRSVE